MKQLRGLVLAWGSQINPWLLLCIIGALNVNWLVTLQAFGTQFQQVAGYPLLDLQNDLLPATMITPAKVQAQIAAYTPQAKTLYWSFFTLDNIMPPLVFGSFALLWVYFLKSQPNRMSKRLLHSSFILIPLGVGAFDWLENLAYIAAIHTGGSANTMPIIYAGLTFKWIKAACLFPTFNVTWVLAIYHVYSLTRQRIAARQTQAL